MTSLNRIIWLASFPKSGNTWTRVLLANYFMPPGEAPDINTLHRFTTGDTRQDFFDRVHGKPYIARNFDEWLMIRPKVMRAIAASKPGHHFVKTHCQCRPLGPYHLIPPETTAAAIYIMRNPFDVVLSYARHMSEDVDSAITRMTDPKAVNIRPSGICEFVGRWDEHIETWTGAPGLPLHVMRYEDMLEDIEGQMRALLGFLRVPVQDGQMRRAIRAASFDSLKKQEQEKGFRERPDSMKQFFKTGRAGGWRDELSPEQVGRIRTAFLPVLERHYPEMLEETEMAAEA